MITMADRVADCALLFREKPTAFKNIYRNLREGVSRLLDYERKLSRRAGKRGFDWGNFDFKDIFLMKQGPGGGVEATPGVTAFFITATLLDVGHDQVAVRALETMFAGYNPDAANAARFVRGLKINGGEVCPVTGHYTFGGAWIKILSEPDLLEQFDQVSICAELGIAMIIFKDGAVSPFVFDAKALREAIAGRHTFVNTYGEQVRELINGIPPATRARLTAAGF